MSVTFSFHGFERAARRFGVLEREIPYALSRTINKAAEVTRKSIIEELWPQYVTARNKVAMRAATRLERSTKRNLTASIVADNDVAARLHIGDHARGGIARPRGSGNFAIPNKAFVKRGARGVLKGQQPRNLPNSFTKNGAVYQRIGPKGRQIRRMYTLAPSNRVPADVPFESFFARRMREEVQRQFPIMINAVIRTSFGR